MVATFTTMLLSTVSKLDKDLMIGQTATLWMQFLLARVRHLTIA